MIMKKSIQLLMILILCLSLFTGCNKNGGSDKQESAKGVKMYLTVSSADTFRQALMDTAKEKAEAIGAEITLKDAEGSLENQLSQIQEAVDGGYDIILCNPVDVDTTLQLQVTAGDIPMLFWNSCPDEERLTADKAVFVGSNEEDAGKYQAEYILEEFADQDTINVAILEGQKLHSATLGRTNALKSALNKSGKTINYVFDDYADWDTDIAKSEFEVFLKTKQPVDVVACNNDSMALGVMQACQENGVEPGKDLKIVGIDATAEGCQAIEAGTMAFTVCQSATGQGEYLVKAAARISQGDTLDGLKYLADNHKYVWVPFEKVDSSNVKDYE